MVGAIAIEFSSIVSKMNPIENSKRRKETTDANIILEVARGSEALVASKKLKEMDVLDKLITDDNSNRKTKSLLLQDMCDDVIRIIYEFFDNVRDIFNLAMQSKLFLNLVTSDMVIRAAVFEKGLPGEMISRTIKSLKDKSIYVPSTLRLLRLVNGKRCERLDQCWGYNMTTSTSSKVCSVWMPGVFTCHDCAVGLSAAFNRDGAWACDNNYVLKGCFGWTNKALVEPFYEKGTGLRVGPIVPLIVIKQVSRSYNSNTERLSALSSVIDEETKRDMNADKSARMIQCYEYAVGDAEAYNERRSAEIIAKAQAQKSERLASLRSMYDMLSIYLADEPWRDAIMECDWRDYDVYFHCSIISRAVEFYCRRPALINQKAMFRVAGRIKNMMGLFISTNLLTADFLQHSSHPFAFVLYEYISQNVTLSTILRKIPYSNQKFDRMLNMIQEGQLNDGLMLILHGTEILNKVFAFGVVPDGEHLEIHTAMPLPMQDLLLAKNFREMAERIWSSETTNQRLFNGQILSGHQEMTFTEAKHWWEQCNDIFSACSINIIDFLSASITIEFIEETAHDAVITEQKIKNLTKVFTYAQYKPLLQSRNFVSLLSMQRNQLRF